MHCKNNVNITFLCFLKYALCKISLIILELFVSTVVYSKISQLVQTNNTHKQPFSTDEHEVRQAGQLQMKAFNSNMMATINGLQTDEVDHDNSRHSRYSIQEATNINIIFRVQRHLLSSHQGQTTFLLPTSVMPARLS